MPLLALLLACGAPSRWTVAAIQRGLAERAAADQEARRQDPPDFSGDPARSAWIAGVVGNYGWPTRSVFGDAAAHDAWLLVQHADLPLQERCLALMEPLVATGEVSPKDHAMLLDRVRMLEGRPQPYGSQYQTRGDVTRPCPLDGTREEVEARRKTLGMSSMDENAARMAERSPGRVGSLDPWPTCGAASR